MKKVIFLYITTLAILSSGYSQNIQLNVDLNYSLPPGKNFINYKNIYNTNDDYDDANNLIGLATFAIPGKFELALVLLDLTTGTPVIRYRTSQGKYFNYKVHGTLQGDFRKKLSNGTIDVQFDVVIRGTTTLVRNQVGPNTKSETMFLGLASFYTYTPSKRIIYTTEEVADRINNSVQKEKINKLFLNFDLGNGKGRKVWDVVKSYKQRQTTGINTLLTTSNTDSVFLKPADSELTNVANNEPLPTYILGSPADEIDPFEDQNMATAATTTATLQNSGIGKQFIDRGNDGETEFYNYDSTIPYNTYYLLNKTTGKFLSTDSSLIVNANNKYAVPLAALASKYVQVHTIATDDEDSTDLADSLYTIQPVPNDERDVSVGFSYAPYANGKGTYAFALQPRVIGTNSLDIAKSKYRFIPNGNGSYTITNNFANEYLCSLAPNSSIALASSSVDVLNYVHTSTTKTAGTEWFLIPSLSSCINSGNYYLINKLTGQYLQSGSSNNSMATTKAFTGATNQQFAMSFAGDGFFTIDLQNDATLLSLGTNTFGKAVTQNTDTIGDAVNQQFLIVPVDSGYFKLMTKNADKELAAIKVGTSTNYEVGEVLYSPTNTANQWQLIRIEEEEYSNRPVIIEYAIDTTATTSTLSTERETTSQSTVKEVLDNTFNQSSVFPNPTTGKFTVVLNPNEEQALVVVLNGNGQKIAYSTNNGITRQFDITHEASGVYYVQVTNKTGTARMFKLLKK